VMPNNSIGFGDQAISSPGMSTAKGTLLANKNRRH
jgi:hypothetical protein